MAKTGESYSTARMHLLKEGSPAGPPSALPIGAARSFAPGGPGVIYQLKIALLEISPTIWRRLHVPADRPLSELALVLIESMGWTNSHLHQFTIAGVRYAEPDPEWELEDTVDEVTVSLRDVLASGTRELRFLYDFGDHWEHAVEVESVDVDPLPGVEYPTCIAGERACPPEDCGGTGGYENLLDAMSDPEHEAHEDLMTWLGGAYDPAAFSVTRVNVALARLVRKRRRGKVAATKRPRNLSLA
jgi:hypothetical protein